MEDVEEEEVQVLTYTATPSALGFYLFVVSALLPSAQTGLFG